MSFQGSLAELHLPDIVQLMSVSGKTGVFHLQDGPVKGEIFLKDGQIVHAQLDDAQGEEAVYALAIWNRGEFRFEPGVSTDRNTITKSNTNLLMEAARRLDEWRVLQKKIPSTDHAPEFVIQEGRDGQINLNTGEWLILSKIDGRRSVKQIAAAAGLPVFDVAKILYGLVATGLLRLREPAKGAASPKPVAATATPAAGRGLERLDRIRDAAVAFLGAVGESVVSKHHAKARADLTAGAGDEAVEEAIQQIVKATAILRGPQASEALAQQLRGIS
jgi:hypothetical protein